MIMTRTINTVFSNMEDALKKLDEHPPGDMYRTPHLESVVKQLPLFLAMAADLAIHVEELIGGVSGAHAAPQADSPKEEGHSHPTGQYL